MISMDKGEVTALTLLDLSAVFDTIDHATLTDRLSVYYGISGQAQIWFSSYLKNRHHSVKIKDTQIYIKSHSYMEFHKAIISSFDITHHLYADDAQIYLSLSVSNTTESLEKLQQCLIGVSGLDDRV